MSFKRDVKKCINQLQADYMCNIQNYPRVENDYIENKIHSLYPHLPFKRISPSYNIIKKKTLKLEKKSSLLYLSQKRLISPSQAHNYAESIDDFFDENLVLRNQQKAKELEILKKLLIDFLEQELKIKEYEEQKSYIIKKYNDIFDNAKKDFKIKFYTNESVSFFHYCSNTTRKEKSEPKKAFESYFYKKMKQQEKLKKEDYLLNRRSLLECIEDFKTTTKANHIFTSIDEKINNVLLKYEINQ